MSIEKNNKNTLKHEESGFTIVINHTIQSIRNDTAAAIYGYLATMPADWTICKQQLQNHYNIGRDKVNKAFKYLKDIGAIEIIMNRDTEGQATGWTTTLKRKLPSDIQNTENQYSGKKQPVDNLPSRILKNQNLDKPESGKTAPTKQRCLKNKDIKETNKPTVFSCSKDVQNHLEYLLRSKNLTLSQELISQIVFYVGERTDYDTVCKLINTSLKLIREKKWNIPSGWNGITSKSIKDEEAEYEHQKQIQIIEDGKMARAIAREVQERAIAIPVAEVRTPPAPKATISPVASSHLKNIMNNLRGAYA